MKASLIFALCLTAFESIHSTPLGITNGDDVKPNSIPFQAHVNIMDSFQYDDWNCTGVLLSENYVLTTPKCFWGGGSDALVTLGAHDISKRESSQQYIGAKFRQNWEIFPNDFVYETLQNNIALIKLPTPAKLNAKVQAAPLAEKDNIVVGQKGIMSGWGVDNYETKETTLKSASVTIVDNKVCAEAYPELYTGPETICTQGDKKSSACWWDAGAPLVIDGVVVAIYSAGPYYIHELPVKTCVGKPNLFTKVSSYIDWIKNHSDL